MASLNCTDQDFLTSAKKYRKEFLRLPVLRLLDILQKNFTIRPGIRYEEKVYSVDADMQFGPYNPKRTADLELDVNARTLKTYFGSVRREFDPNAFYKTVLGSEITKGEALKGVEVARLVLSILSGKLGDHIARELFTAVRNDSGTTTHDLFNGFDTITASEITGGGLATTKGNLYEFSDVIDSTNAVDLVKAFLRSGDDFLMSQEGLKLYMPYQVWYDYMDDYKITTGAISYNQSYRQIHPEGFENVTFVPMFQKRGSEFLQLTTKNNMLIGVNQTGEEESITVEKHDVVLLTFFATLFFGCDFESIDPTRLLVGMLKKKTATTTPSTGGSGNSGTQGGSGNQGGDTPSTGTESDKTQGEG